MVTTTGQENVDTPIATADPAGAPFNEQGYLDANPDVAAAVASGQFNSGKQHFDLYGKNENRSFAPNFGNEATSSSEYTEGAGLIDTSAANQTKSLGTQKAGVAQSYAQQRADILRTYQDSLDAINLSLTNVGINTRSNYAQRGLYNASGEVSGTGQAVGALATAPYLNQIKSMTGRQVSDIQTLATNQAQDEATIQNQIDAIPNATAKQKYDLKQSIISGLKTQYNEQQKAILQQKKDDQDRADKLLKEAQDQNNEAAKFQYQQDKDAADMAYKQAKDQYDANVKADEIVQKNANDQFSQAVQLENLANSTPEGVVIRVPTTGPAVPLSPDEYKKLVAKYKVGSANFGDYFVKQGKQIFLKSSFEQQIVGRKKPAKSGGSTKTTSGTYSSVKNSSGGLTFTVKDKSGNANTVTPYEYAKSKGVRVWDVLVNSNDGGDKQMITEVNAAKANGYTDDEIESQLRSEKPYLFSKQ
jgi:hypothetical protein